MGDLHNVSAYVHLLSASQKEKGVMFLIPQVVERDFFALNVDTIIEVRFCHGFCRG
jgi:hypothetical protein